MTLASIENIPNNIKQYIPTVQRMWVYVYNSVFKSTENNNTRALTAANAVLSKNIKKFGSSRYGHNTQINYLVDRFLGRL